MLVKSLFDEYGGFADKRIRNLAKSSFFIVDDRTGKDVGADKQLYSYFCMIFTDVVSDNEVRITLRGNIPMSEAVEAWIARYKARHEAPGGQPLLEFSIIRGEEARLKELADALRAIVAPGKRYQTANYKYVCPRTAASLERLGAVLNRAWAAQQGAPADAPRPAGSGRG